MGTWCPTRANPPQPAAVIVGSGKRDCVSCKMLRAKEAGVHSPKHICRGCGSLERPQLQSHAAARGRTAGGWEQGLSHGLGDGRKPDQNNQKTISHLKMGKHVLCYFVQIFL